MTKRRAHFQAFGYEPLRMKPAHFASGFFIALTQQVYPNELLNKVAVIKANKGLLGDYTVESLFARLQEDKLIAETMTQEDVGLLRVQMNGIVNNDSAMYPAFPPYRPKGNDYTFISPRMLTTANRTDGFAGFFVFTILEQTKSGMAVLKVGHELAKEPQGALEQFIEPLRNDENPETRDLQEDYERDFGELDQARINEISGNMQAETDALKCLCANMQGYSHYKKIRYYVLGLLAWLMSYMLKTASQTQSKTSLMFFDFTGKKGGRIRSQSQACYARLRETVRRSYIEFADAGRFDPNPFDEGLFNPRVRNSRTRPEDTDFKFLETHFSDLALRMGYIQPRASQVPQKHFELQPDTLRVLMLSVLDGDAQNAITLDKVCERLKETWHIVMGGLSKDIKTLRSQHYFGFDEEDLQKNTTAFSRHLQKLNMAFEPSDGLVLCSRDIGEIL